MIALVRLGETVGVALVQQRLQFGELSQRHDAAAEVVAADRDVRVVTRRREHMLVSENGKRRGDKHLAAATEIGWVAHLDIMTRRSGRRGCAGVR